MQRMPAINFNSGASAFLGAASRSQHRWGVHASALDGRVGLICNHIDPLVYAYLVYTKDGQPTDCGDVSWIRTPFLLHFVESLALDPYGVFAKKATPRSA